MNTADRQLIKLGNMLAEHMGTVDGLRRELRESRDQHRAIAKKQDAALVKLDAIQEVAAEMQTALKQKEPAIKPQPKAANVAQIEDWKPGKTEIQTDLLLEHDEAALTEEYLAMYQERAGA